MRCAAVALAAAALLVPAANAAAHGTHHGRHHHHHRNIVFPLEIDNTQYAPLAWGDIPGWAEDDHLHAFKAFRVSCNPIALQTKPPADVKALGTSLRDPCLAAKKAIVTDAAQARSFFEEQFLPVSISKLGDNAGFVTGYYEPVVNGSRTQTEEFSVPIYRRPSNLFVRGFKQSAGSLPNKGQVFRKIGRRKLVPYYDRAEIEDGILTGRGLEICWVKSHTDLLFIQIQGSARIKLDDGSTVRINYDAHNGYPYTPVGRVLIDRGIVPREQMSMQRIRAYMDESPDNAKELRRQNRSYIFFREVKLSDQDEAVGAQGVPLTAGRSIAVDKALHVYGTPFFIEGALPIESEQSQTPFRRLMVAQDTGSAIIGPARADIYFGAGAEAGKVSGRLKHPARFVMLIPKSLDPVARGRTVPLPEDRPSAKIAKLFPQKEPPKDAAKPEAIKPGDASAAKEAALPAVAPLLPEARPQAAPQKKKKRRYGNRHRSQRWSR
jgi:membrane-bound lytic murein transglycosylase A